MFTSYSTIILDSVIAWRLLLSFHPSQHSNEIFPFSLELRVRSSLAVDTFTKLKSNITGHVVDYILLSGTEMGVWSWCLWLFVFHS